MPFRVFSIAATGDLRAEEELNQFLRTHRAIVVERRLIETHGPAYWSFCVDFVDRATPSALVPQRPERKGIDYREVLPPDQFAVFSRLRDLRREFSQGEGIPVYKVFTNLQLATMVQDRITTQAAFVAIPGIGEAKWEKYGARFLSVLRESFDSAAEEFP